LATYGGIWQVFADESPQIAKQVCTDRKSSRISGKSENLSVVLEKMVTLLRNLATCATKSLFLGKNSADRKLRYVYFRL
jgi:hypothetical protein